jgi:hypothetical protein
MHGVRAILRLWWVGNRFGPFLPTGQGLSDDLCSWPHLSQTIMEQEARIHAFKNELQKTQVLCCFKPWRQPTHITAHCVHIRHVLTAVRACRTFT